MDLSEILDYHTVMSVFNRLTIHTTTESIYASGQDQTINTAADGSHSYIIPFSIDSKPLDHANISGLFELLFVLQTDAYTTQIQFAATQTATDGEVTCRLAEYGNTTGWQYSSNFQLDIGVTYFMHIVVVWISSTEMRFVTKIVEYADAGNHYGTIILSSAASVKVNDSGGNDEISFMYARFANYYSQAPKIDMRIYEPHYLGEVDVDYPSVSNAVLHPLFGAERYYTLTFYNPSGLIKEYLLPPINAFQGSIYDQTDVLNGVIEDLATDLDTANTNLATANAALVTANAEITTLQGKLTVQRASNLDNVDNSNLLTIQNLASFTPSIISNLNNDQLPNIPNLSTLTPTKIGELIDFIELPGLSDKIGFLSNINNNNLLGITSDHIGSFNHLNNMFSSIIEEVDWVDFLLLVKYIVSNTNGKYLLRNEDKFNITFDPTNGVKLDIFATIEGLISSVNTSINSWITANQTKLDEAHVNMPSGVGIPFEINIDVLPSITFPRIASFTINGYSFTMPTANWNIIQIVLKFFEIGFPMFTFPTFSDIVIPSSNQAWFSRGGLWQKGEDFTPDETYNVFRDFFGKDLPAGILFGKILKLLKNVVGSQSLTDDVIRNVMNAQNMTNINEVVKAFNNTETLLDDTENLLPNIAGVLSAVNSVKTIVEGEDIDTDSLIASVAILNTAVSDLQSTITNLTYKPYG